MKILYAALIVAVLPSMAQAETASKVSADHAIAGAKAAIGRAAALNDQWLVTMASFKAAQAAARKGDYKTAETQAKRARMFADLSVKQATAQKKMWRKEIVR